MFVKQERLSWPEAKKSCEEKNASLFAIYDRQEIPKGLDDSYWTGMNEIRRRTVFRWSTGHVADFSLIMRDDNTTSPKIGKTFAFCNLFYFVSFANKIAFWGFENSKSYARWKKGKPFDRSEKKCAMLTAEGAWRTRNCRRRYPYICEITSGRKAKPPKLYVGNHKGRGILVLGRQLKATCSGFVPLNARLEWLIHDAKYRRSLLIPNEISSFGK
ncbi:macrophage mannose receptor 1 [Plakobranchus ocellatus]|uniref:Macrophage mannose receptor 1 n=1 Tax=Plakobranchus ocellatus TaxID=259542 RepID=A0AAV3ZF03_9GAST|nr:macrophage mannose receptor 1 [Plakobranchus ocellatus]